MSLTQISRIVMMLFLAGLSVMRVQAQGPLTPSGPPGPTMKSLDQIEPRTPISSLPYTITTSGSYYLTTDLTGASGSDGITVQASDVTIDLRGFALTGVAGSLNGVNVSSAQRGLAVFGGVVKSWGAAGINAANASSGEFNRLILSQNSSHGLVAGANSEVRDCVASENSGDGLELTSSGFVENNNCQSNSLCGIHVLGNACRVEANHFGGNGTSGLQVDGSQNLIVKNSAVNNTTNYTIAASNDYGQFYVSPGAGFTNNNPWANFSSGIAAPTCSDGIKNGAETDVDCGGGTCAACATGKQCNLASDCVSGVCSGGVCAASCSDGVKDGNETDVDCGGGTCAACATGKQCTANGDCVSGVCSANVCVAASCSDGIKDGNETDVDCGGGTCAACATGKQCFGNGDCASGVCSGNVCVAASCSDGIKDGAETDVDCGGGTCSTCAVGKHCNAGSDCVSGVCSGSVCVAASCSDGIKDGAETDVDCGGGTCAACTVGKGCSVNSDCTTFACDNVTGKCASSMCTDQKKDGAETDIDCGGGTCATCATGQHCQVDADCVSSACDAVSFTCVSTQCADHQKDGSETDVDCGGGTCAACTVGKGCSVNSDCSSGACDNVTGKCASSTCTDQKKDGSETDVDCGGGTCATCATGLKCQVDTDCTSSACDGASLLCVTSQCADHRKDGAETDVDCGGGTCATCGIGFKCVSDPDCTTSACDANTLTCVSSQCTDHRQDGVETDVDCGGANACSRCNVGQKCQISSDCISGHTCNISTKVCQ